jgi:hypothetical protein
MLGVGVLMRRLEDCYFVARVQPREGDDPAELSLDNRGRAWVVRWRGGGRGVVEIGYGEDIERVTLRRREEARFASRTMSSATFWPTRNRMIL